jgi:hypothetical protein
MVAVLVGIYYPACRWYLKADAAINELVESEAQGESMMTSREVTRNQLTQNQVDINHTEPAHDQDAVTVENN